MRHIFFILLGGAAAVACVALGFAYMQAYEERAVLEARLDSRTNLIAESLAESIAQPLSTHATTSAERLVSLFVSRERLAGLVLLQADGTVLAASEVPVDPVLVSEIAATAMDSTEPASRFSTVASERYHAYAYPVRYDDRLVGALVIVQNATYIDESISAIWTNNFLRLLVQVMLLVGVIGLLVYLLILKPLSQLEATVRAVRAGEPAVPPERHSFFYRPLVYEIGKIVHSLSQARSAAREEARLRLEQIDTAWTSDRLREFVQTRLKDRPIYVVSNREPYVHSMEGNAIKVSMPASGMVTALESVMEACGGLWVAQASGNADRETADEDGMVRVPPESPTYTLKRIWLDPDDEKGFYTGFSNEALWALCHFAHNRPIFRAEDWTAYRKVNGLFAQEILSIIKDDERPIILVQDFHFALLPQLLKRARPDAQVGIFWHIPWPSAEQFSVNPWRKEVLEGMLGADVIGFHTQQYCNNFMDTVGKEVEALIDYEHFSIKSGGHTSYIRPFPISIAFTGLDAVKGGRDDAALKKLGVSTEYVALGVDRLDYTKGILERFKAVEFLLDEHPDLKEKFTFIQISSPSRESVEKYRDYSEEVAAEVGRINEKFGTRSWRPIVFERRHYSHEELLPLYRSADVCLVTSLHDGMNLVAKEYVAARSDETGVLVLSKFTGAARDLKGALVVNPYSAEETAAAIHQGLLMSPSEQHRRMKAMRTSIRDYNVYRWAAEFLRSVASLSH